MIVNRIVVGVKRSEDSVQVALLVLLAASGVVILLVKLLQCGIVVNHRLVLNHSSLLLEVRSGVPTVAELRVVRHARGHNESTEDASVQGVSAEPSLSLASLGHIGPVLNPSLVRHDANASL